MPDPVSYQEYERLTMERTVVEGFGLDVATHVPCPFCAHPDFMVLRPFAGIVPGDDRPEVSAAMEVEHACEGCGRAARAIVNRHEGGVEFEVVQTAGPDAPEWMSPKPRRVGR